MSYRNAAMNQPNVADTDSPNGEHSPPAVKRPQPGHQQLGKDPLIDQHGPHVHPQELRRTRSTYRFIHYQTFYTQLWATLVMFPEKERTSLLLLAAARDNMLYIYA